MSKSGSTRINPPFIKLATRWNNWISASRNMPITISTTTIRPAGMMRGSCVGRFKNMFKLH